jgi:hypothetical protein
VLKLSLSTIERVFVLIAIFTILVVTFQQMSTDGILPGNDPAVHLVRARTIVMNEKVTYTEVPWYPPLIHSIIAVLQIFGGTLDIVAAAYMVKLLIATLNVLIMLSTYLLSRKLFGIGVAIVSAVFTILSVPLFEMIFWGGYANFLGLAYIAFIFYIMNRDLRISIKTFFLFLGTFTLGLSHQLSAFVFVLMFVPAFLFSSLGSRKKFIVFLAVVVGGGLALLAWYARILIQYSNIIIEHLFFTMGENIYQIPAVTLNALTKNLGVTLYLALVGIPFTFILLWKKKTFKSSILIIFWFGVPFLLSQSFLFGIQLPYQRFIYFFATPIIILAAAVTYNLTKLPALIKSKIIPKIAKNRRILNTTKFLALTLIFTLLLIQAFTFLQRVEGYPQFYERASIASYNSGLWLNHHSNPDGTVIVPRSPGSWFYLFTDQQVMEETDPLFSRNAVAEAVLYSFFEMDNSRTLTREYTPESSSSGQTIYASRYNIWTKATNILNSQVSVTYTNPYIGGNVTIPLSETIEHIYWTQRTTNEAQLVSEYTHELFTIKKVVTFSSNNSAINIIWKIEAHQDLIKAKLAFTSYMEPSLDYKEALVPGVLNWQNPWDAAARVPHDNASYVNPAREWAVVQGSSDILEDNLIAILDAQNGISIAFEFDDIPDWFILGALDNRFIDALRLRYELGDLAEGDNGEISLSVFTYSFESEEIERWTTTELQQLLDMKINLQIQERDFLTYIVEHNIKFVVVDTQQVPSNIEASPALDTIYNNGRAVVYTTKR